MQTGREAVVCIHVAQDRAHRRAVYEDRGPKEPSCSAKAGDYWLGEQLLSSHDRLKSLIVLKLGGRRLGGNLRRLLGGFKSS